MQHWVWTTFNSFQWDLNYTNPEVFRAMVTEMLFLANVEVEILRLDAVAFVWKKLGTNCENLPETHLLIQAFNAVCRIAAPSLIFKSEAIIHPDEVVKYIDRRRLSPGPLSIPVAYKSLMLAESQAASKRVSCGLWSNGNSSIENAKSLVLAF